MPRKIWTGSINFGLVNIPVGLYSATEDHTIQFHQYQRGTTDRVRYRRVNERTGDDVDYQDIVKGREVEGALITVEPRELEEIAPGRSRTIDITTFVDLDEIDPIFFQKTYWLAPDSKTHGRPYDLLRQAMREANRVGIATFVFHGKQYLTAVRAEQNVLALDTLYFADEIRNPAELVAEAVGDVEVSDRELRMAESLIESMSGPWEPEAYEDTYTARVEQLVLDKSRGQKVEAAQPPPKPTDVVDLTEALRRSVDEARRGRQAGSTDLSEFSKSELERRAKELGVRGRSKMSRKELETAVAQAQGGRRKAS